MPKAVKVTEEEFGYFSDPKFPNDKSKGALVRRFTLENDSGMRVQIISYGAAIASILVPDTDGIFRDVVLGFDDLQGYLGTYGENPYFGAAIGRLANRTGNAMFTLNGQTYQLSVNDGGKHHLHGGLNGFDKRVWGATIGEGKVIFTFVSKDGEMGYPGELFVQVTYELTQDNQILINYQATTTSSTPIGLTNHSYFNLGGHDAADQELKDHSISINADYYTPVDVELIPTGEMVDVEGTIFDLRQTQSLYDLIQQFPPGKNGYDHNFCVNQADVEVMNLAARVTNETTKITLEVYSDKPGIQFYSGNFLPDPASGETPLFGKGSASYCLHGAFCLESQNYPNAINLPQFPNPVLNPGETYNHDAIFKFTVSQ